VGSRRGKANRSTKYVATSSSSLGSEMDQEVELQQARGEEQQGEQPERIVPREG
jgi:hypothetical protein